MTAIPEVFEAHPTIYAVRDTYVVIVPVTQPTLMWVKVGDNEYYDDSNGILRSASLTHKMTVPAAELDKAGRYTVCYRRVINRKPYYPEMGDVETYESEFRPVRGDTLHIYHIADAHNRVDGPVAAGTFFGDDLDLLVLNGDIPNHSGDIANFAAIHKIASGITRGRVPVVFSRGNHDMRGSCAEFLIDHTPTDEGRSYYPVRLGPLWLLVLDCGEDKRDNQVEYGNTICCHDFRMRETRFIEKIADDGEHEYAADGVKHRFVVAHNPFTETLPPPFDIEQDTYGYWTKLLGETVRPEFILCGHIHKCYVTMPGDPKDAKGQTCPVIVASALGGENPDFFAGAAITLTDGNVNVKFTDNAHNVLDEIDFKTE